MPALISRSPRKVLIIRAGALGDLLLLRRAMASLGAAGASVSLVAPAGGEVLRAQLEDLYNWEDRAFASLADGEVPKEGPLLDSLRTHDAAIAYTANDALVAALKRIVPVVRALSPTALEPSAHASLTLARPAYALGGIRDVEPPVLRPRADEQARADQWTQELGGEGFLALHPGSGSARKNWPAERFAELAERLAAGRKLLVVEGPADEAAAAPLRRLAGAVVARHLPLPTLGALLARASLYVGNDSGVSHLAAAAGAPTLALFGPTQAEVWSPVGPLVRVMEAPHGEWDRLDAATVAAAARDALRSWERPALPCG